MAQFVLTIKKAKEVKYLKSEDIAISDANKTSKCLVIAGKQQPPNPNTIAMAIFNAFRSASVLADCLPGIFFELSFQKMTM